MIDRDVALLLIGAGIALVSGLIGTLVQHYLTLRADRVKRDRDRREEVRRVLLEAREASLNTVRTELERDPAWRLAAQSCPYWNSAERIPHIPSEEERQSEPEE